MHEFATSVSEFPLDMYKYACLKRIGIVILTRIHSYRVRLYVVCHRNMCTLQLFNDKLAEPGMRYVRGLPVWLIPSHRVIDT